MKKSLSAPNFQNTNKQNSMKKCVSTQAIPNFDNVSNIITSELQVEAFFNTPGLQAGSCMIDNRMFSYDILKSPDINKNDKIMGCLTDLDEFKSEETVPKINFTKRYYEICNLNSEFADRYHKLLKIFGRKNKNSNE
jgi:hypothetical protein